MPLDHDLANVAALHGGDKFAENNLRFARLCLLTTVKIVKTTSATPSPMAICFDDKLKKPPSGKNPSDIDPKDSSSVGTLAQ